MRKLDDNTLQLSFETIDGEWYAVIPEWEGSHADLQMVWGADIMCDILDANAENSGKLNTIISIIPIEDYKVKLLKIEDTPEFGGAMYKSYWSNNYEYIQPFNAWLCDVTIYVFGHLPEEIYIK